MDIDRLLQLEVRTSPLARRREEATCECNAEAAFSINPAQAHRPASTIIRYYRFFKLHSSSLWFTYVIDHNQNCGRHRRHARCRQTGCRSAGLHRAFRQGRRHHRRIDRLCHEYMVNVQGTIPAPLNYCPPGYTPYPKAICTSVNDVVCHGIPGDKALEERRRRQSRHHRHQGRLSRRHQPHVRRRRASILARRLNDITYECMWLGISKIKPGAHLGDIGLVIQQHRRSKPAIAWCANSAATASASVFHEDPQVLHYGRPGTLTELVAGNDLHDRADDQRRPPRNPRNGRRLDHQDQGSQPVGAMGAYGAGDRQPGMKY